MCILLWELMFGELWNSVCPWVLGISWFMQPNTSHHAYSNTCCTVTCGFLLPSRSHHAYTNIVLLWPFPCIIWLLHCLCLWLHICLLEVLLQEIFHLHMWKQQTPQHLLRCFQYGFESSILWWSSFILSRMWLPRFNIQYQVEIVRIGCTLPFILYFFLSCLLLLFLHRCSFISVVYSINRTDVYRFFILLFLMSH